MKNRKNNENRVSSRLGNDDSAEESVDIKQKLKLKRGASLEKSSTSERKKLIFIPITCHTSSVKQGKHWLLFIPMSGHTGKVKLCKNPFGENDYR